MINGRVELIDAILSLRPTAQVRVCDGAIDWLDGSTPISIAELNNEVARLQAKYAAQEYARKRAPEYPSIGDQLDALWKGGDAAAEMLAKVQAVKAKYPKPTE